MKESPFRKAWRSASTTKKTGCGDASSPSRASWWLRSETGDRHENHEKPLDALISLRVVIRCATIRMQGPANLWSAKKSDTGDPLPGRGPDDPAHYRAPAG